MREMEWRAKIGADILQQLDGKSRGRLSVIVQHDLGPTLPKTIQALRIMKTMPFISAFAAELSADEISFLAKHKDIRYISSNRPVSSCLSIARPAIGADFLQEAGISGSTIGVAVIDSGTYPHPDVNGAIDASVDLTGEDSATTDHLGHGTHVAGIIMGRGTINSEYRGIAPLCRLSSLKVFGDDNVTTLGLILEAMGWVLENSRRFNIRVVNLSLGAQAIETFDQDPICQATRLLWNQGIIVVASAGNEGGQGPGTIRTPGACPYCLTVGAIDDRRTLPRSDDTLAAFSSQGPTLDGLTKPDCIAPGVNITSLRSPGSTLDRQLPLNRVGEYYFRLSGTSMAAPMVAGLAALILQRRPDLSPDEVKSVLTSTAEDKGLEASQQGMGYVNGTSVLKYLPNLQTTWQGNYLTVRFS